MFERFTADARTVVVEAQEIARRLGHTTVGTEHLLIAVAPRVGLDAARIERRVVELREVSVSKLTADLAPLGIDLDEVREAVESSFGPGALDRALAGQPGAPRGHLPFSPRAKRALELSLREALRLKHQFIAAEHELLGILREGSGMACRVLADLQLDFGELRGRAEAQIERPARQPRRVGRRQRVR